MRRIWIVAAAAAGAALAVVILSGGEPDSSRAWVRGSSVVSSVHPDGGPASRVPSTTSSSDQVASIDPPVGPRAPLPGVASTPDALERYRAGMAASRGTPARTRRESSRADLATLASALARAPTLVGVTRSAIAETADSVEREGLVFALALAGETKPILDCLAILPNLPEGPWAALYALAVAAGRAGPQDPALGVRDGHGWGEMPVARPGIELTARLWAHILREGRPRGEVGREWRAACIGLLKAAPDTPGLVRDLIAKLGQADDASQRLAIIDALGASGDAAAREVLLVFVEGAAAGDDPAAVTVAVEHLLRASDAPPDHRARILSRLRCPATSVRLGVATGLLAHVQASDEGAVRSAVETETDPDTHSMLVSCLVRTAGAAVAPFLLQRLSQLGPGAVRRALVADLGNRRFRADGVREQVSEVLLTVARRMDLQETPVALSALARLGCPRARSEIETIAPGAPEALRSAFQRALARWGRD